MPLKHNGNINKQDIEMKERQIVAIDVGSTNVVIAVGTIEDDGRVGIQGIVSEPISGIDAGRIDNGETAGRAIKIAKERIESELNIKITEAYAGLSGDFVRCVQVTDYVYVQDDLGNGSNQITERDVEDLDRRMHSVKLPDDREEILFMEAIRYTIDDKVVNEPIGAYGHVLSATYNFILTDRGMRDRLAQCLLKQGIKVKEFAPNALISHLSVATDEDVEEGVVIVDLGGGVTDVSVIMRGKVRHIASIPIGTDAINNDIRTYGIPANYTENLKRRFGSAVTSLTTDDQIVFQSARRGVPKSILRRNLATIIEARLKEIIEWVRREIKEAGCGPKFSPILLLTGGGAEMQHIETLFSQELGIDEVRAVYPEYGFTESMTDHITTSAYATVASLLIFGAQRGACSVAEGPNRRYVTPVMEETPAKPETKVAPAPQREVAEKTPAETEESIQRTEAPIGKGSIGVKVTTQTDEEDIFDTGEKGTKTKWWKKFQDKVTNMGNSFVGNDEDNDF